MRNLTLLAAVVIFPCLVAGCGDDDPDPSPDPSDTTTEDSTTSTDSADPSDVLEASDVPEASDASDPPGDATEGPTDPGKPTDAAEPGCPPDLFAALDQPCTEEGTYCGGENCDDPCQFCNIITCSAGNWTGVEVFPDPNCGDEGGGDPCADVGCAETPLCGQECTAECGRCPCDKGTATCKNEESGSAVHVCSSNNCIAVNPCGSGALCVNGGDAGLGCTNGVLSCENVEAMYAGAVSHQSCNAPEDCQILAGQCGGGLGGCWEVTNTGVTQAQLEALAAQFATLGCISAVCKCAAPPAAATCSDGVCVAVEAD